MCIAEQVVSSRINRSFYQDGKCKDKDGTFMRKNVMLVNRSTVDFRSCNFSGLEAGKLFCEIEDSVNGILEESKSVKSLWIS